MNKVTETIISSLEERAHHIGEALGLATNFDSEWVTRMIKTGHEPNGGWDYYLMPRHEVVSPSYFEATLAAAPSCWDVMPAFKLRAGMTPCPKLSSYLTELTSQQRGELLVVYGNTGIPNIGRDHHSVNASELMLGAYHVAVMLRQQPHDDNWASGPWSACLDYEQGKPVLSAYRTFEDIGTTLGIYTPTQSGDRSYGLATLRVL